MSLVSSASQLDAVVSRSERWVLVAEHTLQPIRRFAISDHTVIACSRSAIIIAKSRTVRGPSRYYVESSR